MGGLVPEPKGMLKAGVLLNVSAGWLGAMGAEVVRVPLKPPKLAVLLPAAVWMAPGREWLKVMAVVGAGVASACQTGVWSPWLGRAGSRGKGGPKEDRLGSGSSGAGHAARSAGHTAHTKAKDRLPGRVCGCAGGGPPSRC